jgi:hypothetical protein
MSTAVFTEVRGISFLRTSPFGHSRKFSSENSYLGIATWE